MTFSIVLIDLDTVPYIFTCSFEALMIHVNLNSSCTIIIPVDSFAFRPCTSLISYLRQIISVALSGLSSYYHQKMAGKQG